MKLSELDSWQTFSIDSRTLREGDVFIALGGDNFDGHDFIDAAATRGALAAIVAHKVTSNLSLIQVNDALATMTQLAVARRVQLKIPIIAITGSCGKTTTKEMTKAILQHCGTTLAAEKSFNNHIGVPLTLLQAKNDDQFAVFEIGANHHGEIATLTRIVKPDVAVITKAAAAHLAGFGDLDGVARAKGEIFQGLDDSGIAVINADDNYAVYWRELNAKRRIVTFALTSKADISAKDVLYDDNGCASFILVTPNGEAKITLPLPGAHNVANALAAAAATYAVSVPIAKIAAGLQQDKTITMRLTNHRGHNDATIIDDSYNANPASVVAALEVLAKRSGKKIFVLGDMVELGVMSDKMHAEVGVLARRLKINHLYTTGKHSDFAAQAFGKGGYSFVNQTELVQHLTENLTSDTTVVVKGSRGSHMENVVKELIEEE